MARFFSSFPSGFADLVVRRLSEDLANFSVASLHDGLVVFETDSVSQKVMALDYFNNSFELLLESTNSDLQDFMREVIDAEVSFPVVHRQSFRVIFSNENQLSSAPTSLWMKLEKKISRETGSTVDRTNPDSEYWLIKRADSKCFFGKRITKHPDYANILGKGELRPEVASFMVYLSHPEKADVVFDPCAGAGGIIKSRLKSGFTRLIASDNDPQRVSELKNKFPKVEVKKLDVTQMSEIPTNSIDKIITDPPWGNYEVKKGSVELFYQKMFQELTRVLKNKGVLVILTGQKDVADQEIPKHPLNILEKYDVLVSGKKARLYKIEKT